MYADFAGDFHHFNTAALSSTAPLCSIAPMTLTRQSNAAEHPGGGVCGGAGTTNRGLPVSAAGGKASGSGNPSTAAVLVGGDCAIAAMPASVGTASIATPIAAAIRIARVIAP
jgi:hypothetical protein